MLMGTCLETSVVTKCNEIFSGYRCSMLFNQPKFQRPTLSPLSSIMMEKISLYANGCSDHMTVPVIFDMKKSGKMLYHNL
jgi:hypothetical protein